MSEKLSAQHCEPCRGGVPPLTADQIAPLLEQIVGWELVETRHIQKTFAFDDWASALSFVNLVGELADAEGHHPDLHLAWGRVAIEIWTHKIGGLSESDFILAAKIDALPR